MASNKETSVGIKLVADLRNYQTNLSQAQKESKAFKNNVSREMGDVKNSISALARGDISALPGFFKAATGSAGGFAKGLQGVKAALIATGIGALLVLLGTAIGAITQYFKGTEEGQMAFKRVMNNIKAITEPIITMFGRFGKAIYELFTGEFSQAWQTAKGAVNEVGSAIKKNIGNIDELSAAQQKKLELERKGITEIARLEREKNENYMNAQDDVNYSAAQRAAFAAKAIAAQKAITAHKIEEANIEEKIAQLEADRGDNDIATNTNLVILAAKKDELLAAEAAGLKRIQSTQRSITKELAKEIEARQQAAAVMADQAKNKNYKTIETRGIDFQIGGAAPDTSALEDMGGFLDSNAEKVKNFKNELVELNETQLAVVESVSGGFEALAGNIVNSLGLAENGFQGFLGTMLQTVVKLMAMALSQSIANAITGATSSGAATGPAAVFTTPAFIAAAVGGVIAAFAAIPKFATGGVVPGAAMYGDRVLARVNSGEEIITRNDPRHRYNQRTGEPGLTEIIGQTKLMDDHILISYTRAQQRQRNRT